MQCDADIVLRNKHTNTHQNARGFLLANTKLVAKFVYMVHFYVLTLRIFADP